MKKSEELKTKPYGYAVMDSWVNDTPYADHVVMYGKDACPSHKEYISWLNSIDAEYHAEL